MKISDLQMLATNPALTPEQVDLILDAPTSETCPHCGQENLVGAEALNRRCHRCRRAYAEAALFWVNEMCTCKLLPGWRCEQGIHLDENGDVSNLRTFDGRRKIDFCPIYKDVLRRRKERGT